jgi:hypothetical protein
MTAPYHSLFAAATAAVLLSGCGEPVHEFECKSPDGTRSASVDSRVSTSVLSTVETKADGTREEKKYSLSRYRGTGLEQISAQGQDYCTNGITPPGYTR